MSTPDAPALTPVELVRWAWRQLTSMRTALLLLLLLALASVPGSVVPQENINSVGVSQWRADHKTLAPIYDKLGLFSVFDSVWFSAIYLLLMISLVGCVVPRLRVYWRAMRARPPRTPGNLNRLPSYASAQLDDEPELVLARARTVLKGKRFRLAPPTDAGDDSVSAERGYLREAGNLVFHFSVLVALVGFAMGQLFGYKAGMIVLVGQGTSNTPSQFDDFAPGSLFDVSSLTPLTFNVDDFKVSYIPAGPEAGQPTNFSADLTYSDRVGGPAKPYDLKVNHPLALNGVSVYLVGNGYAPTFKITDGNGHVAFNGPAVFLPEDASMTSYGVVKVSEARPTQLGFEGEFYPTYTFTKATGPYSQFPDALDPKVSLLAYVGDLGLDTGRPQNVYALDKDHLRALKRPGAKPGDKLGNQLRITLAKGESEVLPNGLGTIEFTGWQRWVKLQVSNSPGEGIALGGVLVGITGLMGSLFIRPRRIWVRARREGGRTVVEVGGLDRSSAGEGLDDEVNRLLGQIAGRSPAGQTAQEETP